MRGEIGGIERQHALRRFLVAAIAEREQARRRAAEIDHDEEEGRERVDAEMRAEPGQAERQRDGRGGAGVAEQRKQCDDAERQRDDQARAIDAIALRAAQATRSGESQQR